jgi:hypothetical protein
LSYHVSVSIKFFKLGEYITGGFNLNKEAEMVEKVYDWDPVDNDIVYPSFVSFDQLIDIAKLKELDPVMTRAILAYDSDQQEPFILPTGESTRLVNASKNSRSKAIMLTALEGDSLSSASSDYFAQNDPSRWKITPAALQYFEPLMEFIKSLSIFKSTGRIFISYDVNQNPVIEHRDHENSDILHEFLWFRTNKDKPLYFEHPKYQARKYVDSYSAWFDTVNQFHGAEPAMNSGLVFSIRVDGVFSDELRSIIPQPKINLASTPSKWASQLAKEIM